MELFLPDVTGEALRAIIDRKWGGLQRCQFDPKIPVEGVARQLFLHG